MMYQHDDGSWSADPVTLDVAARVAVDRLVAMAEVREMWSGVDEDWMVPA